jgi:hypothetical protein
MLTEILAVYAAIVSTVSLAIAYFAYRSDDPKLSGTVEVKNDLRSIKGRIELEISLHNRGRGAITIDSVNMWKAGAGKLMPIPDHTDVSLPVRIDGHSGLRWKIAVEDSSDHLPWSASYERPRNFVAVVGLATGETLTIRQAQTPWVEP